MGKEQHIPEFHLIAHDAAAWLGFRYDETAPDWMHPALHLILVIAPALLAISTIVMVARVLLFQVKPAIVASAHHPDNLVAGLNHNLIRHILQTTRVQQLYLLVLSLSLMPVLYLSLELPKQIVNNVLDSSHSRLTLLGYDLTATQHLAVLSGVFFLTIALNGVGKYHLNVMKGRVAERCLRRMRLLIYQNWRKQTDGRRRSEIVQVLGSEVEPIGGFAADLVSLPITQGGTMITILLFMFVQDPILGAAALTVLPLQLLLLPYLQRIVNRLSRKRIYEMRKLSLHLTSQIDPEQDHARTILQTTASLRQLEAIRRKIHRVKFFAKALSNFLTSLTPFLFYSLGGYFVIQERISLGALIAVLSAHKEFSAPLKELFRFYQQFEDTRIRYNEVFRFLDHPLQSQRLNI
ncbi:ABC transporter transmembrane domain-containing protein [Ruegeria sp. R14_0]|uniref:ABC transporter transmembrane domain-containing protein n=1 Tax=Ruegeria sp. R14_0 TaxID=2821100 RepID=UPI001FFE066C|nr:ABC transporter transmembrane domain-containing protein [Ruegeria sp. R14_0]